MTGPKITESGARAQILDWVVILVRAGRPQTPPASVDQYEDSH